MPVAELQLTNMRNTWAHTANHTNVSNVADTVRHTIDAVNHIAVAVDTFEGNLTTHDRDIHDARTRIGALEQQVAANVRANTSTRAQRAAAYGVLFAGIAGIIVFPASIYACVQTCPAGKNHSAVGCGIAATACVGALASIASAFAGCVGLAL